ncbi:MAG: transposase [Xenococcaceae cyanobacterium MO_188.B32]|nr:transposase [Xenococcaceae cyanobacterium MO_188.B32]
MGFSKTTAFKHFIVNGEKDHLHLIFQYTPQIQLSKLIILKKLS